MLTTHIGKAIIVSMTKDEAIQFFGTQQALADALGMAQSTISEWQDYPPDGRQFQIQQITHGKLKAEPSWARETA